MIFSLMHTTKLSPLYKMAESGSRILKLSKRSRSELESSDTKPGGRDAGIEDDGTLLTLNLNSQPS
jgi:hypothetical protein